MVGRRQNPPRGSQTSRCAPRVLLGAVVAVLLSAPAAQAEPILGTDGADAISGTRGEDRIKSFGGDDLVRSRGGTDYVSGGGGDDRTHLGPNASRGGRGEEHAVGQTGDDTLIGGIGPDDLSGRRGTDTLRGGPGADFLNGHEGADLLLGGAGGDELHVFGSDIVRAGKGRDLTFAWDDGIAATTDCGPGEDLLLYLDEEVDERDTILNCETVITGGIERTRFLVFGA